MVNTALPLVVVMVIVSLAVSFTEEKWAESAEATKEATASETVTNLQFYFHDTVSGKNPSAVRVAQATGTEKSPTLFGALFMADDPLTETPDPNSKLVGRAQGLYGLSGHQELGLIMAMSFSFTEGTYNGSSISIFGKNPITNPIRELPVVGGTGAFRFARGYAIAHTYWLNAAGDAIVGYNVTVVHKS
ncbi:dirigent protein 23-like [Argentina anserina]|uniref:dirigent protein 23-like n=1 Tax=Argentina anserina TaxID=57926 RepID=UPI002176867C|nr:dirigent protein 23-like [Potentilla anserina]